MGNMLEKWKKKTKLYMYNPDEVDRDKTNMNYSRNN